MSRYSPASGVRVRVFAVHVVGVRMVVIGVRMRVVVVGVTVLVGVNVLLAPQIGRASCRERV